MKDIKVKKSFSYQEAQEFDEKFWDEAGAPMRFLAARQMVEQYLKMRGNRGRDSRRLRRTLKVVQRS